jgi:hypothetical protein
VPAALQSASSNRAFPVRPLAKRRFQLGPSPLKKSPAEAGLKLQGRVCPLQGTETLSRSPCVTITHSAVAAALAQRVVIERVRVDMPARWTSNHESPLALLEYGVYCSGGAALNARRWRRRFPPHRHENGLHEARRSHAGSVRSDLARPSPGALSHRLDWPTNPSGISIGRLKPAAEIRDFPWSG